MTAFLWAHHTVILLALAWNFSALLSAMPEIPDNAPYLIRWIHDYLQIVAANLNKREQRKP
jgi:hypothetical protein